jgi:hypothetical protein
MMSTVLNGLQDVGFNGVYPRLGTDNNVINEYFDVYFKQAVRPRFLFIPSPSFLCDLQLYVPLL